MGSKSNWRSQEMLKPIKWLGQCWLIFACVVNIAAARKPAPLMDEKEIVRRFTECLQEYVKIHKQQERSLSALKPTEDPEKITSHQKVLADKIRRARPHAQPGDIFTPEVQQYFIGLIHNEFHGPVGHETRSSINQGEPLRGHLGVNQLYPEGIPLTTVFPTLLLVLPKLPQELQYGIVDRDLILLDVKANLVVDLMIDAIPKT